MVRSLSPGRLPGAAAVVAVALGGALLSAPPPPGMPVMDLLAVCSALAPVVAGGVEVNCAVAGDQAVSRPVPAAGILPVPVSLRTGGTPECVTGPGRPALDTTVPVMSAAFATGPSLQPVEAVFEHQRLDGTQDIVVSGATADYGGTAILDFPPGTLRPGESYRWRVRGGFGDPFRWPGASDGAAEPGWSAWCEFVVGAEVFDLGSLDDAELGVLSDLGLRPEPRYSVTLTVRQWRAVLGHLDRWLTAGEAIDFGGVARSQDGRDIELGGSDAWDRRLRQIAAAVRKQVDGAGVRSRPGRRVAVTLGGDRWATLAAHLDESEEGDNSDGPAYGMALHSMSQQLAGSGGR